MLTLVAIAVLSWPKALTTSVANISITNLEMANKCWRDPKSGYYAYTTAECDGSHRSITLTKDRRVVGGAGFDTTRFGRKPEFESYAQIKEKSLTLSALNGIKVGMTPRQLQSKLGKPARTATRGKNGEFWCAMYKKANMKSREEGQVLRNTYIFKNSKLIEISINLDSVPGCGEDSLSDQGWPWTKF